MTCCEDVLLKLTKTTTDKLSKKKIVKNAANYEH